VGNHKEQRLFDRVAVFEFRQVIYGLFVTVMYPRRASDD
jgi:hypothetical protein